MRKKLDVYLHQKLVGCFEQNTSGLLLFSYASNWLDKKSAQPISQSLPLRREPYTQKECRGFFAGLLPEETNRDIIAKILGISQSNDYAMLDLIGGECAGAVTFLPEGKPLLKSEVSYKKLDEQKLEQVLLQLPHRPLLAGEPGLRISLAGAQTKIAVHVNQHGDISLPLEAAASTHIIKPAIARFKNSVSNEAMCLELAALIGIPTVLAQRKYAGKQEYLLVERYDRTKSKETVRLHQEDFCQALGFPPERKYQSEGGPSLKDCFALLRNVSSLPALDLNHLIRTVIYNVIVGNHDAHSKNFSLLYDQERVRLAPAYDILSTIYYPELTLKMAMKFGKEYKSDLIEIKHIEAFAKECGLSSAAVKKRFIEVAGKVIEAIPQMIEKYSEIKDLVESIEKRAVFFKKRG